MSEVRGRAQAVREELIQLRRYFHMHPELSWGEKNTQKKIEAYLDEQGIPWVEAAGTGVIGTICGRNTGNRVIGIRADIDALPIEEAGECAYKSQTPGVMHACGHDAHIAILLATAKLLAERKDDLRVTVRLIFQPAEEYIGHSGAVQMAGEEMILSCDRLIALHVWGKLPAGYASLRYGPVMAATAMFDLHIRGKGGHGALPHQTVDPVVAGAELVLSLQRIVSREISPLNPAVISITAFQAGTATNVVPDEARLMGTARAFDVELFQRFPDIIKRVADGVAISTRTAIDLDYHTAHMPLINDRACVDTGRRAAAEVFGKDHLVDYELQMSGEDFVQYRNPKCMLLLGGGFPEEERRYAQHSPLFDIDESVLPLGVEYFVRYVEEYGLEE